MLLKEQKPLVQAYVMDQIFDKMESGEAWLAPYYSGDAGILVENNDNIEFVIPEEGEYDLGKAKKRHGSILNLTEEEYAALKGRYGE